jgi:hypothetical protein
MNRDRHHATLDQLHHGGPCNGNAEATPREPAILVKVTRITILFSPVRFS